MLARESEVDSHNKPIDNISMTRTDVDECKYIFLSKRSVGLISHREAELDAHNKPVDNIRMTRTDVDECKYIF